MTYRGMLRCFQYLILAGSHIICGLAGHRAMMSAIRQKSPHRWEHTSRMWHKVAENSPNPCAAVCAGWGVYLWGMSACCGTHPTQAPAQPDKIHHLKGGGSGGWNQQRVQCHKDSLNVGQGL